MKKVKSVALYLGLVVIVVLIILVGVVVYYEIQGQAFAITSGSMAPALNVGDLVFTKSPADIKVGDIVTVKMNDENLVTHRVVEIKGDSIITKGDANDSPDTFQGAEIIGVVKFRVPLLGRLLAFKKSGSCFSSRIKAHGSISAATWEASTTTLESLMVPETLVESTNATEQLTTTTTVAEALDPSVTSEETTSTEESATTSTTVATATSEVTVTTEAETATTTTTTTTEVTEQPETTPVETTTTAATRPELSVRIPAFR